jgi:Domain of unknown function (DUF6916)
VKLDTFAPHVGTNFRLEGNDGALELTLTEATPGGIKDTRRGARAPFSLTFRGPAQPVLPQRIYRLDHAALGGLDIFLVPIGADPEGVTYEAVFA